MFELFTEPARAVLVEAQDLAIELGSDKLTAGHLLFGCAEVREETAGRPMHDSGITSSTIRRLLPRSTAVATDQIDPEALKAIGINYEEVRSTVEQTFGPGALDAAPDRRIAPIGTRRPRFTADAKRSLELSLRVLTELSPRRGVLAIGDRAVIRPGHLLLGLLRLEDSLISSILAQTDTDVAQLSAAVLSQLAQAA
jgi:ATP-dependent Clp protease ATP-binding subunit ClpA